VRLNRLSHRDDATYSYESYSGDMLPQTFH